MSEQTNKKTPHVYEALPREIWSQCYPGSEKVFIKQGDLEIPMRRIMLSGGEPPLDVYDTSGPQGGDVRVGLPALRRQWILDRGDVEEVEREFVIESEIERELITSGDDVADVARFLPPDRDTYSALDVIDYLIPTE